MLPAHVLRRPEHFTEILQPSTCVRKQRRKIREGHLGVAVLFTPWLKLIQDSTFAVGQESVLFGFLLPCWIDD